MSNQVRLSRRRRQNKLDDEFRSHEDPESQHTHTHARAHTHTHKWRPQQQKQIERRKANEDGREEENKKKKNKRETEKKGQEWMEDERPQMKTGLPNAENVKKQTKQKSNTTHD